MANSINNLTKDPLFQLNLAIWLAQPFHGDFGIDIIYPFFFKSKLQLYSISQTLFLTPLVRRAILGKIKCQERAAPDLILKKQDDDIFCILECKTSSFSSTSTTANQARTLLIVSGPIISEVLGFGSKNNYKGILSYFSNADQIDLIEETLNELKREIKSKVNIDSGETSCFGIKIQNRNILLEFSDNCKKILELNEDSPVKILNFSNESDPRLLYFIPYDPNINQTPEEQIICRRILFERILAFTISKIAIAYIPSTVVLSTDQILNSATFNIYYTWKDKPARKFMKKLLHEFFKDMKKILADSLKEILQYIPGKGFLFDLKDSETKAALLKHLTIKFKPEYLDLSKDMQPILFENELD